MKASFHKKYAVKT